jgi:hypothetical protein
MKQLQVVVIGGIYSYTNKQNFTTRYYVTRVTEKSVFCKNVDKDGVVWGSEHREGLKTFEKFTLEHKPE